MTYVFTSFSTVFQSQQNDGRVIIQDGELSTIEKISAYGNRTRDRYISRPVHGCCILTSKGSNSVIFSTCRNSAVMISKI